MAAIGLAGVWGSLAVDINKNISSYQDPIWVAGATVTGAALAILIPGIVMLTRGTKQYKRFHIDHDRNFNGLLL